MMCTHTNQKLTVYLACNLNCCTKPKDFSRSQAVMYTKSGIISETMQDRDIVTSEFRPLIGSDLWPFESCYFWGPWV